MMKFPATMPLAAAAAFVMLLASCSNTRTASADHPVGTGPFDRHGNYIEAWADNPAKWRGGDRKPTPPRTSTPAPSRPTAVASNTRPPQPTARPTQTAARPTQTAARPTQTASRPPTVRPTPRPAPAPPRATRYTVRRGDTLSAIARRNNSTVAKIRSANGIRGDLIRPGQVLSIPR